MIHSRPGFSPRRSDNAVSKVTNDMKPALARRYSPPKPSPVLQHQETAPLSAAVPPEVLKVAPEIIPNPAPSATPVVNEPSK